MKSVTPEQIRTIVTGKIEGKTVREIAKEARCSPTTVSVTSHRGDIKALIDEVQERSLRECLIPARLNIKHAINSYRKPGKKVKIVSKDGTVTEHREFDEQLRDHGFKASMKMMESVGVLPAPAQSLYFTQINNVTTNEIPDAIRELMERRGEQLEVIDTEYEDV